MLLKLSCFGHGGPFRWCPLTHPLHCVASPALYYRVPRLILYISFFSPRISYFSKMPCFFLLKIEWYGNQIWTLLFVFSLLSFENSLFLRYHSLLFGYVVCNILSHFVACLFIFLAESFRGQKKSFFKLVFKDQTSGSQD